MHRDTRDGVDVIVCTVGKTVLLYDARCLDDLHAMLAAHGDWMELGSRRRAEAGQGRHGRGVGPLAGQPGRRLVRAEEGPARPLRHVRAAAAGAPRPGRGRAQPARQPDARDLIAAATRAPARPRPAQAPSPGRGPRGGTTRAAARRDRRAAPPRRRARCRRAGAR